MIFVPVSFGGKNINDGVNFQAWLEAETPLVAPVQLGLVQRAHNFPKLSTKRLAGKPVSLYIKCLGTAHAQIQTLKGWFDPYSFSEQPLVLSDSADANRQYFYSCTVTDLPELLGEAVLQVNLFAADPVLRSVTEYLVESNITSSSQNMTVTPGGNVAARPRIVITPTGGKSGNNYGQRRFIQIVNKSARAFPEFPLDITGGGLNTSALVSAGQLQSDLRDLRLLVNGAEVDFWLSASTPSTNTLIFTNLSFAPMIRLNLRGSIASSGAVTDIFIKTGSSALAALKKLPASGIILIDGELFTYTSVDLRAYALRGCTRSAKGTGNAGHSDNTLIYWVQYDLWIMHGNAQATAWVSDQTKKPIFDLAFSSNGVWVYSDFADLNGVRGGEFKGSVLASTGKESVVYSGANATFANPANTLGLSVRAWMKSGRWQGETARLEWRLFHPAGITKVSSSGEKRRLFASWPGTAALQRSQDGESWANVWNEAAPVSASDWEAWSHQNITIPSSPHVRFYVNGSIAAVAGNEADFEVQSASVDIDTGKLPEITQVSPLNNYYLDLTLTNQLTGEWLALRWPMSINDSIVIDCENKEITYVDGTNAFAPMQLSSIRAGWLDLLPGEANSLNYADSGTSGANVKIYYRVRVI